MKVVQYGPYWPIRPILGQISVLLSELKKQDGLYWPVRAVLMSTHCTMFRLSPKMHMTINNGVLSKWYHWLSKWKVMSSNPSQDEIRVLERSGGFPVRFPAGMVVGSQRRSCSSIVTVFSFEPAPLQDFCVADPSVNLVFRSAAIRVNGMACRNPLFVQADDFFYSGLHISGDTQNTYGYRVSPVTVYQIPGLNTFGLSMMRIDYAAWGANPPHTHPRATEILTVLEGSLQVGFITSDPQNRLITKVLQRGDVFVFPVGLVHFQRNAGLSNAVAMAALSSQNPGVISITDSIFGSSPPVSTEILAQAFQVDSKTVHLLKKKSMHV
ncbi:hypothetical protein R6Q57_025762 [Mikania cordata]